MSEDDRMVLMVDGQQMSVSRSVLEESSEILKQWIASFKKSNPDLVPFIKLSLPDLDLPPFFNRQNVIIDPKEAFKRYYNCLIGIQTVDIQMMLFKTETRILASFVILSDYLLDSKMRYFLDWIFCHRFGRHLCRELLQFARRYHLTRLHQKALPVLIRDESYHIEALHNISLQEITSLMTPFFFDKVSTDPLTEIVKYAARIDRPKKDIRSDICDRRLQIVIHDPVRLEHFVKWFEIIVMGLYDQKQLRYAQTIIDCIQIEDRRQPLPRLFRSLLIAYQNRVAPSNHLQ